MWVSEDVYSNQSGHHHSLPTVLVYISSFPCSWCVYKNYGSRELLDMLASQGLSASYQEVSLYENAHLQDDATPLPESVDGIVQFGFDNADVNIATRTGKSICTIAMSCCARTFTLDI